MANIVNPDNAVVDYSVITALITTVNDLNEKVIDLDSRTKGVDSTGKPVTKIFDAGKVTVQEGASEVQVIFSKAFTSPPIITATLMNATKNMTVRIKNSASLTRASATFALNEKATKTTHVYWVAVGDGTA